MVAMFVARCVVLLVLTLTANFPDATFSHDLIDAAASRDDGSTLRRAPDANGASIATQLSSAQQSGSQFSNSGQLRLASLFVVYMHALTTRARVTHGRAHGARPSRFFLNILQGFSTFIKQPAGSAAAQRSQHADDFHDSIAD